MNDTLEPGVVCGQHGWSQARPDVDAPDYDPFGPEESNFNLLIGHDAVDRVRGSVPHRAYLPGEASRGLRERSPTRGSRRPEGRRRARTAPATPWARAQVVPRSRR
jgi:hypothetical protein